MTSVRPYLSLAVAIVLDAAGRLVFVACGELR